MLWHVREEASYIPDMMNYGMLSTTCVVKLHRPLGAHANPKYICVQTKEDSELPVDHHLRLQFPHRLLILLRSAVMSAALAFGQMVVKQFLIYE
jgi:hypothetical protein